jgi:hypothetical protein
MSQPLAADEPATCTIAGRFEDGAGQASASLRQASSVEPQGNGGAGQWPDVAEVAADVQGATLSLDGADPAVGDPKALAAERLSACFLGEALQQKNGRCHRHSALDGDHCHVALQR